MRHEKQRITSTTIRMILVCLCITIMGATPREGIPDEEQSTSAFWIEARDDHITWVLTRIRVRYGVRLCVEETRKDSVTDHITASERVEELTTLQKKQPLLSIQKERLENAQEMVIKGEGWRGVGWREHRLQGMFEADSLPELLDMVLAGSPYGWYEENGTYVVIPRSGSQFNYPVTVDVEGVLLSEVMEIVAAASPEDDPIQYSGNFMIIMGLRTPEQLERIEYASKRQAGITVGRICMHDAPAIDVLNRAVEAAGGQVAWALDGLRNRLKFMSLRPLREQWAEEFYAEQGR